MVRKKTKKTCGSDYDDKDVPLKHRLLTLFWTLGPAFTRWTESCLIQEGITPQRLRLSELLFDNGPMKMCDLRDGLGVTATNITALVDALEADGMVERFPHPSDRRATLIQLTEKAHDKISFGCNRYKDQVSGLFAGFTPAEQEELFRLLAKVRGALVEHKVLEEPSVPEKNAEQHA